MFLVCFYSKLTLVTLLVALKHALQMQTAILRCAHFLLEISAGARKLAEEIARKLAKKKESRATPIFPANFLAFFSLGDPYLSIYLSRNTGLTQRARRRPSWPYMTPSKAGGRRAE